MDGATKTAILLLSLDRAVAAEILAKLPRDQVERVTLAIANAGSVTRDDQDAVLNEFKVAFDARPLMQPVGPETARELLESSLETADADQVQTRIDEQIQAGPFAFLYEWHPNDIRRLIENEHPQTIAFIAAQLPPHQSSRVLEGMRADLQADVLARLTRLGTTDVTLAEEIATTLKARAGTIPARLDGRSKATAVLREGSRDASRTMLHHLNSKDTKLAASLQQSMFEFREIESLDEPTLRYILQETDDCQWAMALKGAGESLRKRILKALVPGVAQALSDEMRTLGPVRLSEISVSQNEIVNCLLKLDAENRIELPRNGSRQDAARPHLHPDRTSMPAGKMGIS